MEVGVAIAVVVVVVADRNEKSRFREIFSTPQVRKDWPQNIFYSKINNREKYYFYNAIKCDIRNNHIVIKSYFFIYVIGLTLGIGYLPC